MSTLTGLFLLIGLMAFYLLPTIISSSKSHKFTLQIFIINFSLGWTIIGWIGCLVWATMNIKG
jgi:hypothetical protein